MKIVVAVKRVIDPYVKIRIKPDGTGVETQHVKMTMNPFDEIALEEALRIREKGQATEILAVSIGDDSAQETLRHALALGADRAILVKTEVSYCSLNIAKILQKILMDEKPSLILMGKQSIDGDNNQTPQMLAALMDWPQATFASKIVITDEKAEVTREIDGGLETLSVTLPAVISTDLRLNEPRYASLPNIMKAKSKSLLIIPIEDMGLSLQKHMTVTAISAPPIRQSGIKVRSAAELVEKLHREARVI